MPEKKVVKKEPIDRETLHKLLKEYGGVVSEIIKALRGTPFEMEAGDIFNFVKSDTVLYPIWWDRINGKRIVAAESLPNTLLATRQDPFKEAKETEEMVSAQDDYLAGVGLEKCGLRPDQIQKAVSFAQFAGKSFRKMTDMTHGMMLVSVLNLKERIDYIEQNILTNNNTVSRQVVDKQGGVTTVTVPEYSSEEKLMWQKEYTSLIGELRKISDSATNTTLVGEKIARLATKEVERQQGGVRPRKLANAKPVEASIPRA